MYHFILCNTVFDGYFKVSYKWHVTYITLGDGFKRDTRSQVVFT